MSPGAGRQPSPTPDERPPAQDGAGLTPPALPVDPAPGDPASGGAAAADPAVTADEGPPTTIAPAPDGRGSPDTEATGDAPGSEDPPSSRAGTRPAGDERASTPRGPGVEADGTAPADPSRRREEPPEEKIGTFASLGIRNYRLFFSGAVVSNTGVWMQRIAQDWLVHSLTGSAAAVGATIALQFLPMLLFGLYGGVLADRLDKRKLLLCTQAAIGLTGLVLAALTLSGQVSVTHVYVLAFVLGVVTVLDNPARQTFVADMVGPRLLRNAVSLNSANFQTARIIGPTVAGFMIAAVGSGYAFLFNGLSFIAPVTALLLMRTAELNPASRSPRSKGQLRAGLRYVGGRPDLLWPIVLIGFVGTFGFNFPIWIVAFTDGIFDAGPGTYGGLNALMAVGSLTGALIAARWGTSRVRYLVVCAAIFGAFLMALAGAPNLWVFAVLIVPTGLVSMTLMITGNTSLQLSSDPAMRGRVMSLYMMVFLGGTPFGGPLMGWLTDSYGPRVALLLGGIVCAGAALAVGAVLARIGGLRLAFALRRGRPLLAFVPRTVPGGASERPESAARPRREPEASGRPESDRPRESRGDGRSEGGGRPLTRHSTR